MGAHICFTINTLYWEYNDMGVFASETALAIFPLPVQSDF